ncbi:hypothetical protein D3C87_1371320 [compost metagenome]
MRLRQVILRERLEPRCPADLGLRERDGTIFDHGRDDVVGHDKLLLRLRRLHAWRTPQAG